MQKKRLPKVMLDSQKSETENEHVAGIHKVGVPFPNVLTTIHQTSAGAAAQDVIDTQGGMITGSAEALLPPPKISPPLISDRLLTQSAGGPGLRRALGERTVQRYATIAGFGGIIPVPVVNIAAISVIILRMVRTLARLYGVPYQHHQARSVVISLMAGTMPTGLAVATTSTLIYLVPGSNLIGLAVSSITAVKCTHFIGRVFINHFENGGTLSEVQEVRHASRPLQ